MQYYALGIITGHCVVNDKISVDPIMNCINNTIPKAEKKADDPSCPLHRSYFIFLSNNVKDWLQQKYPKIFCSLASNQENKHQIILTDEIYQEIVNTIYLLDTLDFENSKHFFRGWLERAGGFSVFGEYKCEIELGHPFNQCVDKFLNWSFFQEITIDLKIKNRHICLKLDSYHGFRLMNLLYADTPLQLYHPIVQQLWKNISKSFNKM